MSELFNKQFSDYLEILGGEEYRKKVIDYADHEDTPWSLNFQLELLKKVGFT